LQFLADAQLPEIIYHDLNEEELTSLAAEAAEKLAEAASLSNEVLLSVSQGLFRKIAL
jgi:hypothetical protein